MLATVSAREAADGFIAVTRLSRIKMSANDRSQGARERHPSRRRDRISTALLSSESRTRTSASLNQQIADTSTNAETSGG